MQLFLKLWTIIQFKQQPFRTLFNVLNTGKADGL